MAFEADHNRAALSQKCAIVLRRTDFDSLGWLTSVVESVVERSGWRAGWQVVPTRLLRMLRASLRASLWMRPSTQGL